MAEFLRVSGIPVPVLEGEARHRPTAIGEVERAEDGTKLVSRRAIKEAFSIRVAHQAPSDGIAWKKLFMGEGQVWSFSTSPYSSKGLGPTNADDTAWTNAEAKYGAGSLEMVGGNGQFIANPLPAGGTKWTVMCWRKVDTGAWVHYATTSTLKAAGDAYVDGVLNASEPTSWLTVTPASGEIDIQADATDTTYIDDLVVLPFEAPASWFAAHVAYGAAFSQLAKLDIDGDLVDANVGTKTVCAEVTGVDLVAGYLDGVYYQSIRVLDVELEEG